VLPDAGRTPKYDDSHSLGNGGQNIWEYFMKRLMKLGRNLFFGRRAFDSPGDNANSCTCRRNKCIEKHPNRGYHLRQSCITAHLLLLLLLLGSGLLALLLTLLSSTLGLGGLLGSGGLGTVVLGHGLDDALLLLGLDDGDRVGESLLGTSLALGVGTAHDLDLDTENTLAEENVTSGVVNEVLGGLTGVDHETVL